MKFLNPSALFALVGLVASSIATIVLYKFFGPKGGNLGIIGIRNALELLVFPLISLTVSYVLTGQIFHSDLPLGARFFRGASIAVCSFLACIVVYTSIVITFFGTLSALWLSLASIIFGGIAFAIPSALISGLLGVIIYAKPHSAN